MRVWVSADLSPIKAGIEARSAELRLCGHGESRQEAMRSLASGVRAFLDGLQRDGQGRELALLAKSGLTWEPDGDGIEVIVEQS